MRYIINIVLSSVVAYVFIAVGWISLDGINPLAAVLAVSLAMIVVDVVVGLAFTVVFFGTCGIGCVLVPALFFMSGLVTLWGLSTYVFPGQFIVNASAFQIAIMALALSLLRSPSSTKKSE